MRPFKCAILLAAATLSAEASGIDVTTATEVTLDTGNTLGSTVSAYGYMAIAGRSGVPIYPTQVTFELVSAPVTGAGQFLAELGSRDGSVEVDFPSPLTWQQGEFQGFGYTGPISALYGSMHLSQALSSRLFGSGSAILVLTNNGAPVTLGLPSYRIVQALDVSFSGGGFGVGGIVTRALFDPPDAVPSSVPEPQSAALLVVGAALCAVLTVKKRISYRDVQ